MTSRADQVSDAFQRGISMIETIREGKPLGDLLDLDEFQAALVLRSLAQIGAVLVGDRPDPEQTIEMLRVIALRLTTSDDEHDDE